MGVSRWTIYLQSTIWESRDLPLGEIDAEQLVCTHSRYPPFEITQFSLRASNSHYDRFKITHRLRPTQNTGRSLHCQVENHVQTKFATPILYAIDKILNYDIFSTYT